MSRRTSWSLAIAVCVVLAIVGVVAARGHRTPLPKFETNQIDRGKITARVTATGTLNALTTVQVGTQVSGRVSDIFVDFNSSVKKDQLIAQIDAQLYQAALEQAHANYLASVANWNRAKVQALDAKRQFERSRQLMERKLVAQADLDTAQATYDAAAAQVDSMQGAVEQAKAALHQSEINLRYTRIISPINGTVISRNVDVGQTVASAFQAPTLFSIAEDIRKMQVHTSVAEADVGKLTEKMPVTFKVDAYPNDVFNGVVSQIRNSAQTVQNVVTYDAVVDVRNEDLKLRPGMTANVTFVYAEKDDVLRVTNAALRFRPSPELLGATGQKPAGGRRAGGPPPPGSGGSGPDGRPHDHPVKDPPDRRTVWLLRNTQPVSVPIKIGVSDGTLTEIVEGDVREGDDAITDALATDTTKPSPTAQPPGGMRRMF